MDQIDTNSLHDSVDCSLDSAIEETSRISVCIRGAVGLDNYSNELHVAFKPGTKIVDIKKHVRKVYGLFPGHKLSYFTIYGTHEKVTASKIAHGMILTCNYSKSGTNGKLTDNNNN